MFSPRVRTVIILLAGVVVVGCFDHARKAQQTALGQRQIVFDSRRDGTEEIYVMDSDGSNQQRLTRASGEDQGSWHPAWSPDGKKIAFSSNRDGNPGIYLMGADGSNVRRLTHTPGKRTVNECPDWSLDGRRIAFCSNRDGKLEIYVLDADGSNLRRLTHTPGMDKASANPDWSPDGQQIAFGSTRDGKSNDWTESEIYVMASDGANVRRLTHTPGKGNWTPRWSPDGKKIIFCSNRGVESEGSEDAYEIYVMDADGSNVRQLTTNERSATRPHWSPDGKKVVYHSARDGNPKDWKDHEIYVMDADGSNVRRLTFNKAIDGHPAW